MESIWSLKEKVCSYPSKRLRGDLRTKVLIIGGGMAGILTAYQLKEAGVPCIVAEAKKIGRGVTCNTTAKITAQHGLIYDKLIHSRGPELAWQYYKTNQEAVEAYRTLAERFPCDFKEQTAYVYSTGNRQKLEKEQIAYERLGIPFHWQGNPPLPVQTMGALGMERQAQFHPLKLFYELAQGLEIYEDTFITEIEGNKAIAENGTITADRIVLATHFPLVNIPGAYFMKLYQHRSYAIALEDGPALGGMYLDEYENGLSFRNYQNYLIIGGGDHKTGKKGGGFAELRGLAQKAYPNLKERYSWATQDCMSLDGVPYIGVHRKSTPHLYVATGFSKWGMTGSMIASIVLRDLISTGKSEYEALFSPQRSMLSGQLFVNMASAAGNLLRPGKRCPHMGCALKWNKVEKTWDCPCHGSRFDRRGDLITGPAKRDIHVE